MTTLRIAVESSEAVAGVRQAQAALNSLAGESIVATTALDALEVQAVQTGAALAASSRSPDPLGVRATIASAEAALARLEQAKAAAASSGGTGTSIDPSGIAILQAQERALARARGGFDSAGASAAAYGATVTRALPTGAIAAHARSILTLGAAFVGLQGAQQVLGGLVEFQDQLLEIEQSTGLAGEALDRLGERVLALGAEIPVPTRELLALAAAAGRLQIKSPDGIEQFVRDAGQLRAIIPGLGGTIEDFGNKLGQLLNLVGQSPSRVNVVADVLARLDDQSAATGDQILETGVQIARAGSGFIDSAADALAFGAALASLGAGGRQASTAVSSVLATVREALTEGGAALNTLTALTGQTVEELRESFRTDAAQAFIGVLEAVGRAGADADKALSDLGLASAEEVRNIGPLISNTRILTRSLDEARDAAERGGDASDENAKKLATLGGQARVTGNLLQGMLANTDGLAAALGGAAAVVNDILGDLIGLDDATDGATRSVQALAGGLEAAAIFGGGALVIGKLVSLYQAAIAPIAATTTALGVYGEVTAIATVQTTGLAAAMTRARAASIAFATSPAGIALAIGGAVAGIIALNTAFDEVDTSAARAELDAFERSVDRFRRIAEGLEQSRDLELRFALTGDPELKVEALRRRLSELEDAANAAASVVRQSGSALATIPVPQLEALKVEELFPDVDAAKRVFGVAVREAVRDARKQAQAELDRFQELDVSGLESLGAGLAGQLSEEAFFTPEFRRSILDEIGGIFGPDAARQAQLALDSVFGGLQIPGLSGDQSAAAAQELRDAIALISTGSIDSTGIDRLTQALVSVGAVGPTATSALDAFHAAIAQTRAELDGLEVGGKPDPVLSDFYRDEADRIREQIQSAQLAINSLTVARSSGGETQLFEVTGIAAHVQAIEENRRAYEALNATRVEAQQITPQEAASLNALAAQYQDAALAVLEYQEELNLLGTQQELIGRAQGVLGQRLQLLGDAAGGETAGAFALMREQIDLATRAEELNIRAMERAGQITPEVAQSYLALAQAQRRVARDSVDLRQRLADQARAVGELGEATAAFSRAATDSLLGLRDPAEAFRDALTGIIANLVQVRLQAAALGGLDALFGGGEAAGPSVFRQAASQQGVGDLFRGFRGEAPDVAPEALDLAGILAPAQAELQAVLGGLSAPVGELGVSATAGAGALDTLAQAALQAASAIGQPAPADALPAEPVGLLGAAATESATQLGATSFAAQGASASLTEIIGPAATLTLAFQNLAASITSQAAATGAEVASGIFSGASAVGGSGSGLLGSGASSGGASGGSSEFRADPSGGFGGPALRQPADLRGPAGEGGAPGSDGQRSQSITIYQTFSTGNVGARGLEEAMRYSPRQLERDLRDVARRRF